MVYSSQPLEESAVEAALEEKQVEKIANPLDLLGWQLRNDLNQVCADRAVIEQRWLEDYQQYQGEYDENTRQFFAANPERSSVFLNITRPATDLSVAQLSDLLFPVDDKNFGVEPTPVPEIQEDLMSHEGAMDEVTGEPLIDPETGEQLPLSELAHHAIGMIRHKAKKMEREIDDVLKECNYPTEARRCLHHAGLFGTGILCGPEGFNQDIVGYQNAPDGTGMTMMVEEKLRPRARHVAPWDFYPDMSAASLDEAEFIYERSFMTKTQMLSLIDMPGVIQANVAEVLKDEPGTQSSPVSGSINALRLLATNSEDFTKSRYEVWTYTGPIEADALKEAGLKIDPEDSESHYEGVVVFCNDKVHKAALLPLDTEARPYSVFNWREDEFSIFGFGVPHSCRNEQRILNTAWRLMLDNSAKSAGPQVVIKRSALVPGDGSNNYTLTPWKIWLADETVGDVRQAFTVFNLPSVQEEMANVLQLARQFLDQTVGLPPQPGQGDGQAPSTLGGMTMLFNSSNTDRRRQVRDWDDWITVPLITRFFQWLMQYSDNEDIKGDFKIVARGTSALLMKEQQAINLMAVLDKYAAHPAVADAIKPDNTLRKVIEAMHIPPDEVVKTEEELEAEAAAAQEQEPEPDIRMIVEEMRTQQVQMREETRREIATYMQQSRAENAEADRQLKRDLAVMDMEREQMRLQIEAMKVAQSGDVSYQKILADLKKHRQNLLAKLDLDRSRKEDLAADRAISLAQELKADKEKVEGTPSD
jgi:hypothetical protein